ncbi:MAG: linear amide C-N hydrolase [Puniceicoccaceae bacterium]|nr:MAG: linear amide C-N hydrolase [Puniceicoccaceae bacterium]
MENRILTITTATAALLFSAPFDEARACTRVVYKGPNDTVLTARSMDFSMEIPANLWAFPRGMERNGETGANAFRWSSQYGSLIASSWDIGTSDGMNEKGLVANLLWLVGAEYPPFDRDGGKPGMAVSVWAQYVLDSFATVADAVETLRKEEFTVVTDVIPGTDKLTTVHLSLSDATGDNAIIEYVGGQLVIHHDPSYVVMTNEPVYEQQLAILAYWNGIPGTAFLPGTNRATDRFVRAHFYIHAIPQTDDPLVAVASVFSVIRNASVPYGITTEGFPNLSSTRWRVVADQKHLVYFYENVLTPNVFWVDLNRLDFSEGGPVLKLKADEREVYAGEVSAQMVAAEPFAFHGL